MTAAFWLPAVAMAGMFLLGLLTGILLTALCVAARRGDRW